MAAAPVLLDELIEEFLLRLPPAEPETLVHAALVCKPWYRIISASRFRRRFLEFHRAAPMLGLFCNISDAQFVPTCSFRPPDAGNFRALDARHGRVLLSPWDDVDEPFMVPVPLPDAIWGLQDWHTTVLCVAAASGSCDHRDCHGGPFVVVYMAPSIEPAQMSFLHVYVYSSDAASWSEMARVPNSCVDVVLTALVGSTL